MVATDDEPQTYRAKVDQQDGGPGSHTEDESGGSVNDVASGGVSERRNEDDDSRDADRPEGAGRDIHGDPDTVT